MGNTIVNLAVKNLQKRILENGGGVLHPTDPVNSALIVVWLSKAGLWNSPNASVSDIEEFLYKKVSDNCKELVWSVKPPKLRVGEEKAESVVSLAALGSVRAEKGKKIEADAAYAKLQTESRNNIARAIDNFYPPSRTGGCDRRLQEDVQKLLRAHLAKEEERGGVNLADVLPIIQAEIQKQYRIAERRIEQGR